MGRTLHDLVTERPLEKSCGTSGATSSDAAPLDIPPLEGALGVDVPDRDPVPVAEDLDRTIAIVQFCESIIVSTN